MYFGDTPLDTYSYVNKRAEMMFSLRHIMRAGRFHANLSADVRRQFIEQTFVFDNEGRQRVESKAQQKERGLSSPDELEAICLSVAPLEQWWAQAGRVAT